MPKFTDLISTLGFAEDGITTAYPESFLPDIQAAYADDMSIPDARIQVLEADLAAAQAEVIALKAHNYELLVSAPVVADDSTEESDEDPDGEPDDAGVDGLFKEKE